MIGKMQEKHNLIRKLLNIKEKYKIAHKGK